MARARLNTDYDPLAWFYNQHWTRKIPRQMLAAIDELLIPRLPSKRSRILDLCCGTGQIAARLTARGFAVTGIDKSGEMLALARRNAPRAEFIHMDARFFTLPPVYEGAISVFDSLNHIMSLKELTQVFANVRRALLTEGLFLFDMNMERGFLRNWQEHFAIVEDDNVCVMKGKYDRETKVGHYEIALFRRTARTWRRTDAVLNQRCYGAREINLALRKAGFAEFTSYDAAKDLKLTEHAGRTFFLARRD